MEWSNICANKHTLAHTRTQKTYTIWGIFGWFGCSYVEIRANARSLLRIQQLMSTFYISIVCNTECIRSWSRCVFAIDAFNMQEQRKPNPFLVYVWFRVWYDGDGGQSVSHSFLSFLPSIHFTATPCTMFVSVDLIHRNTRCQLFSPRFI